MSFLFLDKSQFENPARSFKSVTAVIRVSSPEAGQNDVNNLVTTTPVTQLCLVQQELMCDAT